MRHALIIFYLFKIPLFPELIVTWCWFSIYRTFLLMNPCLFNLWLSLAFVMLSFFYQLLSIFPRQLLHLSLWFSWLTFSPVLAFSFADTTWQEIWFTLNFLVQYLFWSKRQGSPPDLMASRGNVQEVPTPPLTSPRWGSMHVMSLRAFDLQLLHLVKLLFQGIKLFLQTCIIFWPLQIDSQVYELPRVGLGWRKKTIVFVCSPITTTSRVCPASCLCCNKFTDIHSKSQISG